MIEIILELDEDALMFSREEIENMNNYELLAHFKRITQQDTLECTHCKRPKTLDYWIHSIRKRCMKNGLYSEMNLPKTCDERQALNSICNPINNKVYRVLRNPASTDRRKQAYINAKEVCFEKIDMTVRDSKYI